ITDNTYAQTYSETLDASSSSTSVLQCGGHVQDETHADGGITKITTCSAMITETTTCRSLHFMFDGAPFIIDLPVALMFLELKTWFHVEINLGSHIDLHFLTHFELHLGPHMTFDTNAVDIRATHVNTAAGVAAMFGIPVHLG